MGYWDMFSGSPAPSPDEGVYQKLMALYLSSGRPPVPMVNDGYETARQVNVGAKTAKAGAEPYPNADDNMFLGSARDEKIIRAKRSLQELLPRGR